MKNSMLLLGLIAGLSFTSCKKDLETAPQPTIRSEKNNTLNEARINNSFKTIAITQRVGASNTTVHQILEDGQVLYDYTVVSPSNWWRDYGNISVAVSNTGKIYVCATRYYGNKNQDAQVFLFVGEETTVKIPDVYDTQGEGNTYISKAGKKELRLRKMYELTDPDRPQGAITGINEIEINGDDLYGLYGNNPGIFKIPNFRDVTESSIDIPITDSNISNYINISNKGYISMAISNNNVYVTNLWDGRIHEVVNGYVQSTPVVNSANYRYRFIGGGGATACGSRVDGSFLNFVYTGPRYNSTFYRFYNSTLDQSQDNPETIVKRVTSLGFAEVTDIPTGRLINTEGWL